MNQGNNSDSLSPPPSIRTLTSEQYREIMNIVQYEVSMALSSATVPQALKKSHEVYVDSRYCL